MFDKVRKAAARLLGMNPETEVRILAPAVISDASSGDKALARYCYAINIQDVSPDRSLSSAMGYYYINNARYFDLLDEMVDTDPIIKMCLDLLTAYVLMRPASFEFPDEFKDMPICNDISDALKQYLFNDSGSNANELLWMLTAGSQRHGRSTAEIVWGIVDGLIVPKAFYHCHPGQFCFDREENLYFGTPAKGVIPVMPLKFVTAKARSLYDNPWGEPAHFHLRYFWYFKKRGFSNMVRYSEKFSTPLVHAEIPPGLSNSTQVIEELQAALASIEDDSALITRNGEKINIHHRGTGSAQIPSSAIFDGIIAHIDSYIVRSILGAELNTQAGTNGARALGEVHERTTLTKVLPIARLIERAFNAYVIKPFVELNFGTNAPMPYYKIDTDPDSDATLSIQLLESAQKLGIEIAVEQARNWLGIRPIIGDEETIKPPIIQPVMPGMPPAFIPQKGKGDSHGEDQEEQEEEQEEDQEEKETEFPDKTPAEKVKLPKEDMQAKQESEQFANDTPGEGISSSYEVELIVTDMFECGIPSSLGIDQGDVLEYYVGDACTDPQYWKVGNTTPGFNRDRFVFDARKTNMFMLDTNVLKCESAPEWDILYVDAPQGYINSILDPLSGEIEYMECFRLDIAKVKPGCGVKYAERWIPLIARGVRLIRNSEELTVWFAGELSYFTGDVALKVFDAINSDKAHKFSLYTLSKVNGARMNSAYTAVSQCGYSETLPILSDALKGVLKKVDEQQSRDELLSSRSLDYVDIPNGSFDTIAERVIFASGFMQLGQLAQSLQVVYSIKTPGQYRELMNSTSFAVKLPGVFSQFPEAFQRAAQWMLEREVMTPAQLTAYAESIGGVWGENLEELEKQIRDQVLVLAGTLDTYGTEAVQKIISDSILQGMSCSDFINAIQEDALNGHVGVGRFDSYWENVYRTESMNAYTKQQQALEGDDLVKDYVWGHEAYNPADRRSRSTHAALRGKKFKKGSQASETLGWPPFAYRCRCSLFAIVDPDPENSEFEESPGALAVAGSVQHFKCDCSGSNFGQKETKFPPEQG